MKHLIVVIIAVLFSLSSCYSDQEEFDTQLIETKVQESIMNEIKQYQIKCLNDLLYEAEVYADSLVIQQIAYSINDTINFPGRPQRPGFPHPITLDDSTRLKPVLVDSIIRYLEQRAMGSKEVSDSIPTIETDINSF